MLEKRVVMPDPSSASLVRKLLAAPSSRGGAAAAAAAAKGRIRGKAPKEQREWRKGRFGQLVVYSVWWRQLPCRELSGRVQWSAAMESDA